jgi:hypothetical protein
MLLVQLVHQVLVYVLMQPILLLVSQHIIYKQVLVLLFLVDQLQLLVQYLQHVYQDII